MKTLLRAFLCVGAVWGGVAVIALSSSCADDGTTGTTSGTPTSPTSTSTSTAPCTTTDCVNQPPDSGSTSSKDAADDAPINTNLPDGSNPNNTMTIADSGNNRFASPHPFADYTCP